MSDIRQIEQNWREGHHRLERINCGSENSKGILIFKLNLSR